ncbi:MAG: ABC transporter ATP-binding protein [Oscillospiraceae bacterium]|nr:ABC transporter ATP-binding protein [Oscillospiraceae bacterium]
MSVVIEAKNLTKRYGYRDTVFMALDGVDVKIKKGESVAIVGKSGSGKSTLMHILALMDKQTDGELLINETNVGGYKSKQLDQLRNKEFGFVFQHFFLNPRETVLENVALPLKIAGISRREAHKRARAALKAVDLEDKARNKGTALSGGQKQRACIARAVVTDPQVVFADEPTGNLDSTTGKQVEELLFNLNKNQGITLVIVTHDSELAAKCDRQIVIKDGKILEG